MGPSEAYMLSRDAEESQRLDWQHNWIKGIAHNKLFHSSIPLSSVRAIADVATGTGAWIRDVARSWESLNSTSRPSLVGFDISTSQFPSGEEANGIEFCEHDATTPFAEQYQGAFDVVNVRLMSYAITTSTISALVTNIAALLRPGGYLQWQECDAIDAYASPDTEACRNLVSVIVKERIARGLFPGIVTPLARKIFSIQTAVPGDALNSLSWSEDALRVMHLETIPTRNHPEQVVRDLTKPIILQTIAALLESGVQRRASQAATATGEAASEEQAAADELAFFVKAIKEGRPDLTDSVWDCDMTWIVARKAVVVGKDEHWMTSRF